MTLTKRKRLYSESSNPRPGDVVVIKERGKKKLALVLGFNNERLEKLAILVEGRFCAIALGTLNREGWDDEDCDV